MKISPNKQLPLPTVEDINQYVSDEEIFNYYLQDYKLGSGTIESPLRTDDTAPSFAVYYYNNGNKWLYKDFGHSSGNAFQFVQELFKFPRFYDAVVQIVKDFGLTDKFAIPSNIDKPLKVDKDRILKAKESINLYSENIEIIPFKRQWNTADRDYWKKFNISKSILTKYNVFPVKYIGLRYGAKSSIQYIKCDKYAYAYEEFKDGKYSYKIYQPFNKTHKFRNNIVPGAHFGYRQLPESGEILIITKSGKDVMSIMNTINSSNDVLAVSAIAIQGETYKIKPSVMEEYKSRFTTVFIYFDNDAAGRKAMQAYGELYSGIHLIQFDDTYPKDFSDIVEKYGTIKSKELLCSHIY